MHEDIADIVQLRFANEVARVDPEVERDRAASDASLAARGLINSSARYYGEIDRRHKRAESLSRFLMNMWVDTIRRKQGRFTSADATFVYGEVSHFLAGAPAGCSFPGMLQGTMQAFESELARRMAALQASIRRELDATYREEESLPPRSDRTQGGVTNIYHLSGHNARVNINSTDSSVNNVTLNQSEVFTQLRQTITSGVQDENEQRAILDAVTALEQAAGKPTFAQRYTDFIEVAANHVTLLAPFIPALSELLRRVL